MLHKQKYLVNPSFIFDMSIKGVRFGFPCIHKLIRAHRSLHHNAHISNPHLLRYESMSPSTPTSEDLQPSPSGDGLKPGLPLYRSQQANCCHHCGSVDKSPCYEGLQTIVTATLPDARNFASRIMDMTFLRFQTHRPTCALEMMRKEVEVSMCFSLGAGAGRPVNPEYWSCFLYLAPNPSSAPRVPVLLPEATFSVSRTLNSATKITPSHPPVAISIHAI